MSTDMIYKTKSTDSADTEKLGQLLGSLLKPPVVLDLVSDLGGGKTTFVRGLAAGLGSSDQVVSPTFTLNRIYKAKNLEIHHFDFYRLDEPGVLYDQLEESLQNSRVVTVIEWSKIVKDVLPANRLTIEFKPVADNPDERDIEIEYPEPKEGLIKQLESIRTESKP